jgi:hypothetical protein
MDKARGEESTIVNVALYEFLRLYIDARQQCVASNMSVRGQRALRYRLLSALWRSTCVGNSTFVSLDAFNAPNFPKPTANKRHPDRH